MAAIDVNGVTRRYKRRARGETRTLTAVDDVTLQIEQGELFGLLGPNGAGKTTLVKMITTVLLPDAGTIQVLGLDAVAQRRAVRSRIGCVLGGERGLYDRLSGWDNLRYAAELYYVPKRDQQRVLPHLVEQVGLAGREHDRVETYSRGMKQRLHLARAMVHDPDVLILDEPTIGLDPVAMRALHQLIVELSGAGTTILLTTHYMLEAEFLCERLAVIRSGRILEVGTPAAVRDAVPAHAVLAADVRAFDPALSRRVRELDGVLSVQVDNVGVKQRLRLQLDDGSSLRSTLDGILGDVLLGPLSQEQPTLEDAYVRLIESSSIDAADPATAG